MSCRRADLGVFSGLVQVTGPSSENQQSGMTEAVNPVTHVAAMKAIQTIEQLEQRLSEPPERVLEAMRRLSGDIILLGA
ncbi:MAG: hypothetical protein DME22_19920, partial [Verrucomicrobia bacterium]